jgi:head-tail adaptor
MSARFPRRLLIDTVTVQRTTATEYDERGLVSDEWTDVASSVPTRLTLLSETENRDGRNTVIKTYSAVVPGDTDVKASDRLYDGTYYYEIQSVGQSRLKDGTVYYKSLSLLLRE